MTKIPFDIKYRPQIESGEYKVMLDCGVEAEILAWDKPGEYPIVCMAKKEGAIPFRTNNNGIAYHYPEGSNYSDLFIITPEPELSKFEEAIGAEIFDPPFNAEQVKVIREESAKLLALARKELEPEVLERLEAAYKNQDEVVYENGKRDGKAEALKDLPRWVSDGLPKGTGAIDISGLCGFDFLRRRGRLLSISSIEKLPGFKEG